MYVSAMMCSIIRKLSIFSMGFMRGSFQQSGQKERVKREELCFACFSKWDLD